MYKIKTKHFQSITGHIVSSALYLCVLLAGAAQAASTPVVFVVDAALDKAGLRAATEIALETSSQLPDQTAFSVIIYDDVVQKVVPLTLMGTERLSLIKETLDATDNLPTSNLAAGIERAVDELKDQIAGHIILFTTSRINTSSTDDRAQYLQWYQDILLPDAAERSLSLTFVTEADPEINKLLQMARSYQNTSIIALHPSNQASTALKGLLQQADALAAIQPTTSPSASTSTQPSSGASTGVQTGASNSVSDTATDTTTNPDTAVNPTPIGGNNQVQLPAPEPEPTTQPQISESPAAADSPPNQRRLLFILWFACVALALIGLGVWLIWSYRNRRQADKVTALSNTGQTGSAYLPLNEEMPSTRFDALAEDLEGVDPYQRWTVQARTARQVDPDATRKNPADKG